MIIGLEGALRDYAWGSRTAIAELTGHPAGGGPEAELWFGAHPSAPSTAAGEPLDRVIAEDPHRLLGGDREQLPFLLKLLAADRPLSLQVHPDAEQAREGYAREEAAGIAVDDPARNYKDASPKPEMILALSPTLEALAGFRHLSETRWLFAELVALAADDADRGRIQALADRLAAGDPAQAGSTGSSAHLIADGVPETGETAPAHTAGGNALHDLVEHLLRGGPDVDAEVAAVVRAAARAGATSSWRREFATVEELAAEHPGDPGVVVALLLNRVSLPQGQAIALEAGVVHAYLHGLGVELMSSSDNVLRGGLTDKHVDVDELLRIVRFEAIAAPVIRPQLLEEGAAVFRTSADDFELVQVGIGEQAAEHGYSLAGPESVRLPLGGPAIVVVLFGGLEAAGESDRLSLARGDAAFVSADERALTLTGSAIAVVATTP